MNSHIQTLAQSAVATTGARQMQTWLGVFTLFPDMFLRPRFGTQYYEWWQAFISLLLTKLMIFAAGILSAAVDHFYFHRDYRIALYQAGILSTLVTMAFIWHAVRIWRRVIRMDLEANSRSEEDSLWFFRYFPKGDQWHWCRLAYEPAFISLAATFLAVIGIVPKLFPLIVYLAAFALFSRAACVYWEGWSYVRNFLDEQDQRRVIEAFIEGAELPQKSGNVVFSSIPASTPRPQLKAIATRMVGLPPEVESLLTKAA